MTVEATVNVTVPVVPFGVVTLTRCEPSVVELASIANVVLTVVAVAVIAPTVIPVPPTFTDVAPVRFVPVRVIARLAVFSAPVLGVIVVTVGGFGLITVKTTAPLVPFGVVTLTLCMPTAVALEPMANVAVTVVAVDDIPLTTIPPPPSTLTAVAPVRLLPVSVTDTVVPKLAVAGVIVVSAGFVPTTAKSTKPVIPLGVVTLTLCVPMVVAMESMAKVAATSGIAGHQ
jgi:hypothetical protein